MSGTEGLVEALPPLHRLALAYAPARAREPTLALLALDQRLAGIVRHSHEPMLAQLRLAWWREQLKSDAGSWPAGEPLLAALKSWQGRHGALTALVDGWEFLTGPAPLPAEAFDGFADGRGDAFAALAAAIGAPDDPAKVRELGRAWALADLAGNVGNPEEQATVRALAASTCAPRLSRAMRVLAVLHGLAQRRLRGLSPSSLLATVRLGLLGR
jgi:phytoene synthase